MILCAATVLLARFTVLEPKEGFDAGYQRHLEWHRAQKDPWVWHGWTIVTGERLGTFVDATMDRPPAEMDAAVSPAEDAADFARNVSPHARLVSSVIYRGRPDLCSVRSSIASPFASMITVRPDDAKTFEATLAAQKIDGACFQLASGGDALTYLVMRPAASLSAAVTLDLPGLRGAITVEAVRYRKDLTYLPDPKSSER